MTNLKIKIYNLTLNLSTMKKIELFLSVLAVVFIVMKILVLPWSGVLLALTLLTLSFFYYFLSFALFNKISLKGIFNKSSYENLSTFKIFFTIGIGWTFSITIVGALFKLELLPYANFILLIGIIAIGIISFVSLIFKYQTNSDFYKQILLRNLIIGGTGIFLILTN